MKVVFMLNNGFNFRFSWPRKTSLREIGIISWFRKHVFVSKIDSFTFSLSVLFLVSWFLATTQFAVCSSIQFPFRWRRIKLARSVHHYRKYFICFFFICINTNKFHQKFNQHKNVDRNIFQRKIQFSKIIGMEAKLIIVRFSIDLNLAVTVFKISTTFLYQKYFSEWKHIYYRNVQLLDLATQFQFWYE